MPAKTAAAQGVQMRRAELKSARSRLRAGDIEAARRLLSHSVACGHDRLALRRYLIARMLGAGELDEFEPFCTTVARALSLETISTMARDAMEFVDRIRKSP